MDFRIRMHSSGTASGRRLGFGWRKCRLQSSWSNSSLFRRACSSPGYHPFVETSGPSSSIGGLVGLTAPILSKKSGSSQDSVVEVRGLIVVVVVVVDSSPEPEPSLPQSSSSSPPSELSELWQSTIPLHFWVSKMHVVLSEHSH